MRRLVRIGLVIVIVAVGYLGLTFAQVVAASRRDEARGAEAIVVFGAAQYDGRPSPVLRARLDHALALYRRDLAPRIVVTGGRLAGDRYSEASVSATYLRRRGVPDEAVLREVYGRNSWQSLASAAAFLRARGLERVILVSDPFHSARVDAMAGELGLTSFVSPTRTSPIGGAELLPYLGKETVAVAAGRIVGFRRLMGVDRVVERVRTKDQSG